MSIVLTIIVKGVGDIKVSEVGQKSNRQKYVNVNLNHYVKLVCLLVVTLRLEAFGILCPIFFKIVSGANLFMAHSATTLHAWTAVDLYTP